jgi:hypothetical protein
MKRSLFSLLLLFALTSTACSSSDSAELQSMAEKIEELEQRLEDAETTTTQPPTTTTTQPPTTTSDIIQQKWLAACGAAKGIARNWSDAFEALNEATRDDGRLGSDETDYVVAHFYELGANAGLQGSLWESLSSSSTDLDEAMFVPNLNAIELVGTDSELFSDIFLLNLEIMRGAILQVSDACVGRGVVIFNGVLHHPKDYSFTD